MNPGSSKDSSMNISFGSPAMLGGLKRSLSPEREIALKKAKTEPSDYDIDVEIFVLDDIARPYALNTEKRLATIGLDVRIIDVDESQSKLAFDKAKNNYTKYVLMIGKKHKDKKTVDLHVLKFKEDFKFPDLSLDSVVTYFNITYQTTMKPTSDKPWRENTEKPVKQYGLPKGNKNPIHPILRAPIIDLGVGGIDLGKKDQPKCNQLPSSHQKEQEETKSELNAPKLQSINIKGNKCVEIETTVSPETAIRGQVKILEFLKAQNCSYGLSVDKWEINKFQESKIAKGTTLTLLVPDLDIQIIQEKLNGKLSIGTKHYFFKTEDGLLVQPIKINKPYTKDNRRTNKMIKSGILPPKHMNRTINHKISK